MLSLSNLSLSYASLLGLLLLVVANEMAPFALKTLPAHEFGSLCGAEHARA